MLEIFGDMSPWLRLCLRAACFVLAGDMVPAGTTLVTPAAKFLVWENTTRKEFHPLELTSKVTTEFAYNGISRGLHKKRYCRFDVISELKCM